MCRCTQQQQKKKKKKKIQVVRITYKMYFFLWGPLISSRVYQKAYLHFLLFPTLTSKFPFNYGRLNKCPDTCGFQTRNLCPWPHATLLPTPVHTSCDVTLRCAQASTPTGPHGLISSTQDTYALQPVVPASGRVGSSSSQVIQTILVSLLSQRLVFTPEPTTGLHFPAVFSCPGIYVLKCACDYHSFPPGTSPSYDD